MVGRVSSAKIPLNSDVTLSYHKGGILAWILSILSVALESMDIFLHSRDGETIARKRSPKGAVPQLYMKTQENTALQ